MNNYLILKKYYTRICAPLIFLNETRLPNNINAKIYLYDFKNEVELNNFKKVFQEYLPYYVKNHDRISRLKIPTSDDEIGKLLVNQSKQLKFNSGLLPNRGTKIDGIYGEIYNDFYLRNIINTDRFISYITRRTYDRPKTENKGIDLVTCSLNNDVIQITFSESKFVTSLSSATSNLISDTNSHLDKKFINGFMNFVIARQEDLMNERNNFINEKINQFNDIIEDTKKDFIDVLNDLNFSVKFVYFAIFQNNERNVIFYEQNIQKIVDSFNQNISKTNIKNYDIEVVFIPTFNSSMNLKKAMEDWNE